MILYVPIATSQSSSANNTDYGIPVFVAASSYTAADCPRYREREFGVGYGNSSGYASGRSYTNRSAPPYFRCG